ncbi:MAG: heparinase II/III-family protein [Ruminococcus sp.]|nr:heparinase II/III-family protein [Ruminococcus sp.]
MFYELAQTFPLPFHNFALYPASTNRAAWAALNDDWKQSALSLGRSYLHYDYPRILASDFLDFSITGNRVRYEDKYFARRRALCALVLAECVADEGEFLTDIINGIFCICEESGWQLPPHNSYTRDTPQFSLPDHTAPVLDLFACETGSILAAVSYLLGEKLDHFSPFIRKRIAHELSVRIYEPYINCHFWWMGNGEEPMNNWTIWCTQNVLLSVFLIHNDDDLRQKVLLKACRSTDYFLKDYGEDGCCDEGALYYRHSGLCLFNTLEILNAVTNDHFAGLFQEPKIRNIASYIMNVHIQDEYYVNFADCSSVAGRCSAREFLFARRTENDNMMRFASRDFMQGLPDTLLLPSENNLYYRLQHAFTINELFSFADTDQKSIAYPDIFYPSTGLFLARDAVYFLAAKAGDNGDSHNHNDTGSFIVYKNGLPFLIDVGVETYTKKTFSPQRYEIWTMQSAYHNLPTVNGLMQKDGESFGAADTAVSFTDSLCEIQMDIAPAYPPETGLAHYIRQVSLQKGTGIRIQDSFSFQEEHRAPAGKQNVILSFMTYEEPVLQKKADILSFQVGRIGFLDIAGAEFLQTECIPVTDQRLKTAWKHDIYRIQVSASTADIAIHIY